MTRVDRRVADANKEAFSRNFRALALFAVSLKCANLGFWPHVYAGEAYQQGTLTTATYLLITAMVFAAAATSSHGWFLLRKHAAVPLLFACYALASAIASNDYIIYALRYAEIILAVSLVAFYDGPARVVRVVALSAIAFTALNLASLAFPTVSFMRGEHAGLFRGLTPHKNDLGFEALTYLLALLHTRFMRLDWVRWSCAGACLLFVVLAGSVQAYLLLVASVGAIILLRSGGLGSNPITWVSVAGGLAMSIVLTAQPSVIDSALAIFGRDSTFTGRDRIWALAYYKLTAMPWHGYGVNPLVSTNIDPYILAHFRLGSLFATTHNAYLEALLTYGYVGFLLFMIFLGVTIRNSFKAARATPSGSGRLALILALNSIIGGFFSSEKLFAAGFGWLGLTLAWALATQICSMHRVAAGTGARLAGARKAVLR